MFINNVFHYKKVGFLCQVGGRYKKEKAHLLRGRPLEFTDGLYHILVEGAVDNGYVGPSSISHFMVECK